MDVLYFILPMHHKNIEKYPLPRQLQGRRKLGWVFFWQNFFSKNGFAKSIDWCARNMTPFQWHLERFPLKRFALFLVKDMHSRK